MAKKLKTDMRKPIALDIAIGKRLRFARIDKDFSQEALAKALGISFQQLQKYECGKNRLPFVRAIQCCEILDCNLDWLAGLKNA